jgi:hypothetical protein
MKSILIGSALLLFAAATPANGNCGQSHSHGYYRYDRCDNTGSEYMEYDQAVALGKQMLAEKNVSLGNVARELRAKKDQNQAAKLETGRSTSSNSTAEVSPASSK